MYLLMYFLDDFLAKSLCNQWLLVYLQCQFPPSLSTMLKCVGLFCIYTLLSKYANGKITALHETLYDRDGWENEPLWTQRM